MFFFSASTHTGYQTASAAVSRFADGLLYFPYDLWPSVAAAVNRVRPDRMIVVETDLWPNFLYYLNRRGIPAFLVNARLSDRSFAGYRKIRFLVKPLLRSFHGICAQSERDANRFISLGADPEKVSVSGNLKFDQPVIPLTEDTRSRIRGRFAIPGDKPILVAGSTHPGEETVIARTLPSLLERLPDLRLIIVPRDPKRAASVRSEFRRSGRTALTMTERQDSLDRPFPEVLVADRIGLLKDLYAVAHAAFVGGSLVPKGGHNPLEASACGVPVMFGPHMSDFREVADILKTCGAAVQVDSGEAFIRSVHRFLTDAPAARIAGAAGMRVIRNNRGAVIRTLEQILPERLPWSCPSSV